MKYALVNGERKEATPKATGFCPCCNSEVRAYCGPEKIHHWKHISVKSCDTWYEGETEWHRNWKSHFPQEFQEVVKIDPNSGEKHIADVYLPSKELTIEFQHSPIAIEEINSREKFYDKMLWVIDVQPVSKNIKFHKNIKFEFFETIIISWAKAKDRMYHKLKKEGKIEEAEKVRYGPDPDRDVLDSLLKKYTPLTYISNYFLMEWKYQPKRWNHAQLPLFFDIGGDFIYKCIEAIKVHNGFIVKRFTKKKFLEYYEGFK